MQGLSMLSSVWLVLTLRFVKKEMSAETLTHSTALYVFNELM